MARHRKKSHNDRKSDEPRFRINHQIRVPEIRLVGDNVEPGIYPTRKALQLAQKKELDLVEIAPQGKPPVCRIIDYSKFLYEKKRKMKEIKAKAVKTVIKEIRFGPNTDDHDFEFKARHAERFLQEGAKVKAVVQFRGRSIVFKERGELLLLRFAQRLEEFGTLDQLPKMEGRRMFAFMSPKKQQGSGKKKPASVKKDIVKKPASVKKDIVKKDIVKKDIVKKDIVKKDIVKKDIVKKDIVKKDIVKKDIVKKDIVKKPTLKKDIVKKDNKS